MEIVDFPTELFSDDDTIQKATNIAEWAKLHNGASDKFGKPMNIAHRHKQWMIDAGFKNVKEDLYKVLFLHL